MHQSLRKNNYRRITQDNMGSSQLFLGQRDNDLISIINKTLCTMHGERDVLQVAPLRRNSYMDPLLHFLYSKLSCKYILGNLGVK